MLCGIISICSDYFRCTVSFSSFFTFGSSHSWVRFRGKNIYLTIDPFTTFHVLTSLLFLLYLVARMRSPTSMICPQKHLAKLLTKLVHEE